MRILQALPALNFGGVETETLIIAQAIVRNGDESFVASAGGVNVGRLGNEGSKHINIALNSKNPWIMLVNAFKLAYLIKKLSIDIVHARSRRPAWSAYLACKMTNTPFITTVHGAHKSQNFFKNYFNSVMVRGCKVIAISHFIKSYIIENYGRYVREERIVVVNRGIDLNKFKPFVRKKPNDVFTILLPSRYTRIKGHETAIKAMTYLKDAKLICTGPIGDKVAYYQELQSLVQSTNTGDRVELMEDAFDIPQLMSQVDLVICPSIVPEAFGRTIAEAQAMGIPVIASNIGAPREILVDGVTGYLVAPGQPEELAAAINKARSPMNAQLARANMEQNYSLESMCANTIKIYSEVLNG